MVTRDKDYIRKLSALYCKLITLDGIADMGQMGTACSIVVCYSEGKRKLRIYKSK
jgi:hypothetical protein